MREERKDEKMEWDSQHLESADSLESADRIKNISNLINPRIAKKLDSEFFLMFKIPFLIWSIIIFFSYLFFGLGREFRFSCSFAWCFLSGISVIGHFLNFVCFSVISDFLGCKVSQKNDFSYLCNKAIQLKGLERNLLIALAFSKVIILTITSSALWGGFFIIFLWLTSGAFLILW